MQKIICTIGFLCSITWVNAQSYMDEIVDSSCTCVDKTIAVEEGEALIESIGLCILGAVTPHKEKFLADTNLDLDNEEIDLSLIHI